MNKYNLDTKYIYDFCIILLLIILLTIVYYCKDIKNKLLGKKDE